MESEFKSFDGVEDMFAEIAAANARLRENTMAFLNAKNKVNAKELAKAAKGFRLHLVDAYESDMFPPVGLALSLRKKNPRLYRQVNDRFCNLIAEQMALLGTRNAIKNRDYLREIAAAILKQEANDKLDQDPNDKWAAAVYAYLD